jgi:MFS family permease
MFGQHRKPYFVFGWALFVFSCGWLGCYVEPSIAAVNYLSFVQTMGYLISDVVADALIVERSIYENQDDLGIMRTEGYLIRSVGGIVGAVLGAILYNKSSWGWGMTIGQLCWLQAGIPVITMGPMVPWLFDGGQGYIPIKKQVYELWDLVQRRTVWWPMSFVYFYSLMQISNPVWTNYLVEGLGFDNFDLGLITIIAAVFSWIALYVYRTYFFGVNWQLIYYCTTFLNFILSAMQLLLVFDLTGGIPKLVFACGDYAFIAFSNYMQFMPMCIVALAVIPGGIEGASYAMLTTWMNVAGEVGYDIGTSFSSIWDVSNCVLSEGKIYGLWRLTLLTSCLQLVPVFLIWMFPKDKDAVMESLKHEFRSKTAGTIFLTVLVVSILGTLIYSIVIIYDSGLDDDDGCDDDDDDDDGDDDSSSYLFRRY